MNLATKDLQISGELMDVAALKDAVSRRRDLAERFFDELRRATFDGVGITRASYGEGEEKAHEIFAGLARELGLAVSRDAAVELASGAAHDAAAGTPTAMIFTRNENASLNPDEAMAIEDFMDATLLTARLAAEVATG